MKTRPQTQSSSPAKRSNKLVRRGPSPLVLEQRFMFDGAAVADAADTVSKPVADGAANATDGGARHMLQPVSADAQPVPSELVAAQAKAEELVTDFMNRSDARQQMFALFNGGQTGTASAEWNAAFDQLMSAIKNGDNPVRVELRSGSELQGALGAFSGHGTTATPTIYLNREWVRYSASTESLTRVLVEEIGHSIDYFINAGRDTQGDEGEMFSNLVTGSPVSSAESQRLQQENDFVSLLIDGQTVQAEQAGNTFDVAGATLDFSVGSGDSRIAGSQNTVGETWLYSNVITVGGQQIDAIVKIVSSSGSISAFDSTSTPYSTSGGTILPGADKFLQPNFTWGSSGGSADISISFILGGSYNAGTNPTGTATTLRNVLINSYDLDSSSGNTGKQYTDFTNIGGYELSSSTLLSLTTPSAGVSRFMPPTSPGTNITALPGTTTGDNYRVRVSYDELSSITVTLGDATGGTTAYYALDFSEGPTFTNVVNRDLVLTGGPLSTSETGSTASFSLKLSSAPTADVTVTLTGLDSSEGSLSTTTLTFTTANWDTAQTVTVTGVDDALLDGDITYKLTAASSSSDLNFNGRTAVVDVTNQDNEVADATPPTIVVGSNTSSLKIGETATITFTLSEASSDFTAGDVTVTGGTLSNFSGSGTTYTATFTPSAASGTVSVASGAFSDAANNFNADGADTNNSVALSYDGTAPTIAVTSDKSSIPLGDTATITFTLSEASSDFTAGDVTVTGGTLSNFSGSGTTYTATFTPSAASSTVSVASSAFSDAAGNLNADGADTNNSVALTSVAPTVAIAVSPAGIDEGDAGETDVMTYTVSLGFQFSMKVLNHRLFLQSKYVFRLSYQKYRLYLSI